MKVTCKLCQQDLTGPAKLFGVHTLKQMHIQAHEREVICYIKDLLAQIESCVIVNRLPEKAGTLLSRLNEITDNIIVVEEGSDGKDDYHEEKD